MRPPNIIVRTAIRETVFIVDAQVHVWGPNTPQRPWRTGHSPRRAYPLTPETLLHEMLTAGVARAVLVPPYIDCERNDLALAAAQKYLNHFAVMGRLDTNSSGARAVCNMAHATRHARFALQLRSTGAVGTAGRRTP